MVKGDPACLECRGSGLRELYNMYEPCGCTMQKMTDADVFGTCNVCDKLKGGASEKKQQPKYNAMSQNKDWEKQANKRLKERDDKNIPWEVF